MMTTVRTIVDLPPEQLGALARLCEVLQISRAEAVRRAVDRLLKESSIDQKEVGFGIWRHRCQDSRKLVDLLRDEWIER